MLHHYDMDYILVSQTKIHVKRVAAVELETLAGVLDAHVAHISAPYYKKCIQ